jgi:hypothetical protein
MISQLQNGRWWCWDGNGHCLNLCLVIIVAWRKLWMVCIFNELIMILSPLKTGTYVQKCIWTPPFPNHPLWHFIVIASYSFPESAHNTLQNPIDPFPSSQSKTISLSLSSHHVLWSPTNSRMYREIPRTQTRQKIDLCDLWWSLIFPFWVLGLSDDRKAIVVLKTSNEKDYDKFVSELPEAECRWAVYDFEYTLPGGEGIRNKLCFIMW